MSTSTETTRVVLFSFDPQIIEQTRETLSNEPDFSLVECLEAHPDRAMAVVEASQPGLILLDKNFAVDKILTLVDELASKYPAIPIIVIYPESEVQQSSAAILAGARGFILFPFVQGGLITTLRQIKDRMQRITVPLNQPAQVTQPSPAVHHTVVVYSPKGGVGCSSIAINLAIALRQQINEDVLLVDGKHLLGHSALMLNLRTANSIADLIPHASKLDANLIRQVVVPHVSGIQVLPSPVQITRAQGIRPEELYRVLLGLQSVYKYIVVDGGNYLNDNLVTYMDAAEKIILVVTPNLAALRDARQFLDISSTLSYSKDKILLMLNQAGHRSDVKQSEIENVLRAQIFATIPADEDIMLSSLNEGIPVLLKKPGHAISKAIKKTAATLAKTFTAAIESDSSRRSADILKKSSRLG